MLELLNHDPFVPFKIVLTSGEGYDVANPNLVAVGESLMHVFFPRSDRYATLRLNLTAPGVSAHLFFADGYVTALVCWEHACIQRLPICQDLPMSDRMRCAVQ